VASPGQDDNPYAAPASPPEPAEAAAGRRIGLVLAVALIWLLGMFWLGRTAPLRRHTLVGGICVAATQVYPILHFIAGLVSMMIMSWLLRQPVDEIGLPRQMTELAGFLVTLLTGAQLLLVAGVCGVVVLTLLGRWSTTSEERS
jgi:hypothetical protein